MSVHKPSDVQLFVPDQSALYSNSGQPNNSGIVGFAATQRAVDNVGQPQVATATGGPCYATSGGQQKVVMIAGKRHIVTNDGRTIPLRNDQVPPPQALVSPCNVINGGQQEVVSVAGQSTVVTNDGHKPPLTNAQVPPSQAMVRPCHAKSGGQPLSDPPPYSESVGLAAIPKAEDNVGQPQAATITDKPCNVTSGGQPNVLMIAGQPHVVTNDGRTQPLTFAQVPPPQAMIRTSEAYVAGQHGVPVTYRDQMVLSLFSCLCCTILGVFAMWKAHEARESYKAGDIVKANKASKTAKRAAIAGIIVGTIFSAVTIYFRWRG